MSLRPLFALALACAAAGCATVVPMQTASVVPDDRWRAGGQVSTATFCSLSDVTQCHDYPDGLHLPELRLDVRRGLGASMDLGASVQVLPAVLSAERPLQVGLTLDAKRELLRRSTTAGNAHVLSAGLQLFGAMAGRAQLAPWLQAELAIPLHYGFQTERFEWVAGLSLSRRSTWPSVGDRRYPWSYDTWRVGGSFGLYRRAPSGWAVQLGYLTRAERPSTGALLLQLGWLWDLGGHGTRDP